MPDGEFVEGDHHEVAWGYFEDMRKKGADLISDVVQALDLASTALDEYNNGDIDYDEFYNATWDALTPTLGYLLDEGAIRIGMSEYGGYAIMQFSKFDDRAKSRAGRFLNKINFDPSIEIEIESSRPEWFGRMLAETLMDRGIPALTALNQSKRG
jgi:hypothetical protein